MPNKLEVLRQIDREANLGGSLVSFFTQTKRINVQ
jgi:hypothetical protein